MDENRDDTGAGEEEEKGGEGTEKTSAEQVEENSEGFETEPAQVPPQLTEVPPLDPSTPAGENSPQSPAQKEEKTGTEVRAAPRFPPQSAPNKIQPGFDEYGKEQNERERRKFRMLGLEMESSLKHPLIRKLMRASQSFHLWFDRPPFQTDTTVKMRGGISYLFDTERQAKVAFDEVRNLDIDGCRIKFQAPTHFIQSQCEVPEIASPDPAVVPPEQEVLVQDPNANPEADWELVLANILEKDSDIKMKLHISQLLPSVDLSLLETLFDQENLKDVQITIDPKKTDESKVAVVTFVSEEAAKYGHTEFNGFQIDDGDVSRELQIVPYLEYLKQQHFSKYPSYLATQTTKNVESMSSLDQRIEAVEQNLNSSSPPDDIESRIESSNGNSWSQQIQENIRPSKNDSTQPESSHAQTDSITIERKTANPSTEGAKMNIDKIRYQIRQLIEEDKINWGELNETQELWTLLDRVMERVGWIPEQNLQRAMLLTLEADLHDTPHSWLHNHLSELIRAWKKEIMREARSNRSGREFVMSAPDYRPPASSPPKKKFKNKEHRKAVMGLMGVGALLASVKEQAQGEEGELEDGDQGAERMLPPRPETNSPPALKNTGQQNPRKESKRGKSQPSPDVENVEKPQKRKKAKKAKVEKEKKAKKPKPEPEKPQVELEEGEVSSGSEGEGGGEGSLALDSDSDSSGAGGKPATDNQASSSSSGSSSSESSSSEEDGEGSSDGSESKSKRRKTEKGKKKQSKSRKKRRKERESMRKAVEEQLRQQYKVAKKKQKKQEDIPEGMPPGMAKMMSALGGGKMDSGEMMKKMQSMMPMMPQMMGMFQQMMATRMGTPAADGDPAQRQQQMMQMFQKFQQQFGMMGGQGAGVPGPSQVPQASHQEGQQPWIPQPQPGHHPYYGAQPPAPYAIPPPAASAYPHPVRPAMYPPPYYSTPAPTQPPPR